MKGTNDSAPKANYQDDFGIAERAGGRADDGNTFACGGESAGDTHGITGGVRGRVESLRPERLGDWGAAEVRREQALESERCRAVGAPGDEMRVVATNRTRRNDATLSGLMDFANELPRVGPRETERANPGLIYATPLGFRNAGQ